MLTRIFADRRSRQVRAAATAPVIAAPEPLPLFPRRNNILEAAFTAFHLRTAHNTVLSVLPEQRLLAHARLPAPGSEAILFRATHMPEIGLLVTSREIEFENGKLGGRIVPFLIAGNTQAGAFALRSPTAAIHLCAVSPEGKETGTTDFYRGWIGPWELFQPERLARPLIGEGTERTLLQLAPLLEAKLDPTAVTAWSVTASPADRQFMLPILIHLLARFDPAAHPAPVIDEKLNALRRQCAHIPAIMPPAGGTTTQVERIDVQRPGFTPERLRGGWHFEADGRCLMASGRAAIDFDLPFRPVHAKLRLELRGTREFRAVTLSVNGWRIGCTGIGMDMLHGACLDYWIPREALSSSNLLVTFDAHPGATAATPAFQLSALTLEIGPRLPPVEPPLDPGDLMAGFESLGEDCEFGFVQRHFGIEPLGIFRFAGSSDLSNLLGLLGTDLDGLGNPGSLSATLRDARIYRPGESPLIVNEFLMQDHALRFWFHTWRGPQHATEELAKQENEQKLRYLRRKFLEDLEDGAKIWLLKDARRGDINEAFAFHATLNRRGRNKLFWVTRTIEGRPSGTVEWVGRDLLRGYSDQAHQDAQIFNPDTWLALCRNASLAFLELASLEQEIPARA